MLFAVHVDPGPNFLHDYVKFDPYLTICTTLPHYQGYIICIYFFEDFINNIDIRLHVYMFIDNGLTFLTLAVGHRHLMRRLAVSKACEVQ